MFNKINNVFILLILLNIVENNMNEEELYDIRIKSDSNYFSEIINELLDANQSVWLTKQKGYYYIKTYAEQCAE